MAETIFGEATVVLRARLDELEQDLRRGEQVVEGSVARVQQAQVETMQKLVAAQASTDNEGGFGGFIAGAASMIRWSHLVRSAVVALGSRIAAIPAVATAAGAGLTALSAVAIVALIGALGLAIGLTRDFAGWLRELPARLASVRITLDDVTGALSRMLVKVEDGRMQWTALGQAISVSFGELQGFIADTTGLMENWNEQTKESIRLQNELADRIDALDKVAPEFDGVTDEINNMAVQAQRAAELEGLEGIPRIMKEAEHATKDAEEAFLRATNAANTKHKAITKALEEELKAGKLTEDQYNGLISALDTLTAGSLRAAAAGREMALNAIDSRTGTRVDQFNEQEAQRLAQERQQLEAERQRQAEADARQMASGANRFDSLRTDTLIAQLEAQDKEFEAQRQRLELRRRQAIRDAMGDQRSEEVQLIGRLYDAKLEALRANEQRFQQEQERLAEAQADAQQDALERVSSRILEERLRQAGKDVEAQAEAIRRASEAAIDDALDNGNAELAAKLRELRDLQIDGLGDESSQQFGVRVAGRDRLRGIAGPPSGMAGGGDSEIRVKGADEQRKLLEQIEENTRDKGAMFG